MINFQTSPDQYKHWKLSVAGPLATLTMDVQEDVTLAEGYKLKLNSYDLGVDIELADAVQRLRFEHPEVKAVVITSLKPRIFCAGANIYMLGTSSHAFKVNFCKFTNETRCAIEDDSNHSGRRYIAALNGTASGGGYELAIACDEIYLVDDGNSAVSLPEVPLLGVLPGTGGLTRLVDKRKIRRDRADVFSTLAEGLKGKRAKEWGLIDDYFPTSKFQESIDTRVREIADLKQTVRGPQPCSSAGVLDSLRTGSEAAGLSANEPSQTNSLLYGIKLNPLQVEMKPAGVEYKYVNLILNREQRYADLTLRGPMGDLP
ncbi:MAG TPA: enoyl-CoA hydratase-related protein, partial [Pyrinomonadaceae bacterium]